MKQKEEKSEDMLFFIGYLFLLFSFMIIFRGIGALFNYFF